ncbi:MAG: orotidine-5'-phosphate decarboxylase [Methylacidiphilales bacterium]|nr:orotidine-5'-phosphate decarboxylase [Candidatus Methylacidiphilales bacterium]
MNPENLILALDVYDSKEAFSWVERFSGRIGYFKIGLQLFTSHGPELVRKIRQRGAKVFLDLKLHDIPNTVAKTVESLCQLDIHFLTIHTLGGKSMMNAAVEAAAGHPQTTLLGVTILTHLDDDDLRAMGFDHTVSGEVINLARLAQDSGLHGLVCSPREVSLLRKQLGPDLCLVTPGVRPEGSEPDDQTRIATPQQAILSGSNHVVIGRPILKSADPDKVLSDLLAS